jgi:hypothetical protein
VAAGLAGLGAAASGADFLRKKLNIDGFLESLAFYEIALLRLLAHMGWAKQQQGRQGHS